MKFPFYHNDEKAYTIDDANYDCWRIIVADCDMWHRYATLCELVADCPEMKQLTRPCVVTALNDLNLLPWHNTLSTDKWFLRVTPSWCLELADPCICNEDKYVIATDQDNNPWPLDTKVKWSCSYDWLYCIDIEEAWPQTLVWRPSGPNWPFINPALPTSACPSWEAYDVKLVADWDKWEWKVQFECPEQSDKPQYAVCVYNGTWIASTPCCMWQTWTDGLQYRIWRTVRYYATRASAPFKPIDSMEDEANSYIDWDWLVKWTPEAFARPDSYWVIKIIQKWIYVISFSAYVTFNQVMKAIRCWLYAKTWVWTWFKELNDIKYETWEYRRTWYPEVFNRTWPDAWNKDKFVQNSLDSNWQTLRWWALWTLDATWLPFSRTYVLNVTEDTELAMVVKPDTRWIDPRLIKSQDSDDRYKLHIEWWVDNYWAVTSIEIARVWDLVTESRYVLL